MKLICILPILFTLSVQAQMRCEDLFPVSNVGKIENFKKEVTDVFSYATNMDLRRLQMKYMMMDEFEKVKAIQQFFNHNKVEFKRSVRWEWWPVPKRYEELEILTTGSSETNRYAKKLADLYQTRLIYSPKLLAELHAYGAYSRELSAIYLSESMAMTDIPDLTFFHEVRHMAMTRKELKGDASVVNGGVSKWGWLSEKWPWGRTSKSGYDNYFSLQEAETWHQNFVYNLTHLRQLARDRKINFSDLHKWIEQYKDRGSANMLADTLSLVEYELEVFLTKSPSISFLPETNEIRFGKVGWPYVYSHVVPAKFIKDFLQQEHSDFMLNAESIKTILGEQMAREITHSYLNSLRQNLLQKQEFSRQNVALLQEIQRRTIYLEAAGKPIQELYDLIVQLGKDHDWRPMSLDQVSFQNISRLSESGLDFSKVHSSLYKKVSQKFDSSKPTSLSELNRFLLTTAQENVTSQGYMKVELTYQHQDRQGVLVLEGLPSLRLNRISFERLVALGVKILRADIKIVSYAKVEKRDTSSLDLSYLTMPIEELTARNLYRLDALIEQLRN